MLNTTAKIWRKIHDTNRFQLIDVLMRSLQPQFQPTAKLKGLAASLIDIAQTDELPPTDKEVRARLDELYESIVNLNDAAA